ncbi:TonB-dependent receptor plug domain-containing protein [uncultured Roseovarius sp.]|uniref:TonB-dependent receptor plug domain-containing protein n=1 Tax=uncultured Roseovarius sp. TaxID=293344 RepID=UPI00259AE177|nr:TonB-dependent receptor plug domain-containing protein [uncultured Roseovarius sp.]
MLHHKETHKREPLVSKENVWAAGMFIAIAMPASVQAQDGIVLDPINIEQETDDRNGAGLPQTRISGSPEGSGATTVDSEGVVIRADGSGDANTALTSLPGVQYRNDADTDAGENGDDVLDLKPLELSISGGRVTENNFTLDGLGINSLTGNEDPLANTELSRETNQPNTYSFYGLHSQTQFVPTSMVEEVEIIDSDVSARHGGFQGGVVNYTSKQPKLEKASGQLSFSYSTDEMTEYVLGTPFGINPDFRQKPDWTKLSYSVVHNQPVSDRTAILFGFGRRDAEARKQMDAQYKDRIVKNDSRSDFYSLGVLHEFGNGDRLTVSGKLTDYSQGWDSNFVEDFHLDVETRGLSLDAKYEKEWDRLSFAGLDVRDVKLTLRAAWQDNEATNINPRTKQFNWYAWYQPDNYLTTAFDSWCTADTTDRLTTCRTGGLGSTYYTDKRKQAFAELEGEIAHGSFLLGISIEEVEAKRQGTGFTYYGANERLDPADPFVGFICPPGDRSCLSDQYFDVRVQQDPYNVSVDAIKTELWAEIDQTWGDFGLRAGLRLDHNDVLDNWDWSPRLTGRWSPRDNLEFTLGANRYSSDNYMAYAIHDAISRGTTQLRGHDGTTGVVEPWGSGRNIDQGQYSYTQGNLKTPYTDELALGVTYRDSLTNGTWRLRGKHRKGRDQFSRAEGPGSRENYLTNDGTNEYNSISLEYSKAWDMRRHSHVLDSVGLYVSGVWSERETSALSYFNDDGDGIDDFIYYGGQSYTLSEFGQVTGNLDIPVRSTIELRTKWAGGRYSLGVGADVVFGYDGVIDSDQTGTFTHPRYGRQQHNIFVDKRFKAHATAFLSASARIAEIRGKAIDLNLKVSNLFNEAGNRTATNSNPWIAGRSFYLGTNVTW